MTGAIGRNILSLGASRIVSGLILFAVYIRLVTHLGPHEFGKLSLVMAYYTIFLLLVDLGISRFVIKKISEDKSRAPEYLRNFFVAQLLLSLVVLGIFIFVPRALGYEPELKTGMLLAGFGLFLGSLSLPYSSLLQAWQKIHLVAAVNFLNTALNALWLFLAIWLGKGIEFIFWIYILLGVINIFIYSVLARRVVIGKFRLGTSLVRTMLLSGLPFAFISGFEILISKVDVVIMRFFLPFQDIGWYAGAYRFLDFLTFIPAIVAISLFPFLSESLDLRAPAVGQIISRLNRYMVALALPLGVGATVLADKIILTLFDQTYLGAVRPFQVLIWATVVTFIYATPGIIVVVKKTGQAAMVLGAVAVFNVVANWILVPRFGIMASAWLTVISYLLMASAYIGTARSLANFTLFQHFYRPLAGALIMGGGLYYFQPFSLWILLPAAILFYGVFLRGSGFLRSDDWVFVKSFLGNQK